MSYLRRLNNKIMGFLFFKINKKVYINIIFFFMYGIVLYKRKSYF